MSLQNSLSKTVFYISMLFLFSNCFHPRNVGAIQKGECHELNDLNNACISLKILTDSVEFTKEFIDSNKEKAFEKGQCFRTLMNRLSDRAGIKLNWTCSMVPCRYPSYSFDKSIFKIDVIRLMRAYGCSDTLSLFNSTKGFFTVEELEIIKGRNRFETVIDTMILYKK